MGAEKILKNMKILFYVISLFVSLNNVSAWDPCNFLVISQRYGTKCNGIEAESDQSTMKDKLSDLRRVSTAIEKSKIRSNIINSLESARTRGIFHLSDLNIDKS